jgi:hypothetical protein
MLDEGVYTSVSEIGHAENISKELCEPDTTAGDAARDHPEQDPRRSGGHAVAVERPLPARWEEQRILLSAGDATLAGTR